MMYCTLYCIGRCDVLEGGYHRGFKALGAPPYVHEQVMIYDVLYTVLQLIDAMYLRVDNTMGSKPYVPLNMRINSYMTNILYMYYVSILSAFSTLCGRLSSRSVGRSVGRTVGRYIWPRLPNLPRFGRFGRSDRSDSRIGSVGRIF